MTSKVSDVSFKHIHKKFEYGIYLTGAGDNNHYDLITCSWVMQGSYEGGEVIVNLGADRPILEIIRKKKSFSISLLGAGNAEAATKCAMVGEQRKQALDHLNIGSTATGNPFLEDAIAYIDCELQDEFDFGNGVLLIGKPINGKLLSEDKILTLSNYYKINS